MVVMRQAGMGVPFLRMPRGLVDFSTFFSTGASIADILLCLIPDELEIKRLFEQSLRVRVQRIFFFFLPDSCRCGAKAVSVNNHFPTQGISTL